MKNKILKFVTFIGLGFLEPLILLMFGEEPKKNLTQVLIKIGLPIISIVAFISIWEVTSYNLYNTVADRKVEKVRLASGDAAAKEEMRLIKSGDVTHQPNTLPSPSQVVKATKSLLNDVMEVNKKKSEFNKKVEKANIDRKAQGLKPISYTGRPSFADQILTSLKTVIWGVLLAIIIAVPLGIVLGLGKIARDSTNWVIQIFKPVSPVVWLLLVSMIVKTVMADSDQDLAFIISFISVGLCSMWATLVNTIMGVSSVNNDIMNVVKVLKLGYFKQIYKVILPSAMPLIFTGIRITVSVAWMVLIAIELLAQSPGLGSFVWEEFQNGANDSNAKIIVAMFVIGLIGFMLDRIMLIVQKVISKN